MFTIHLFSQRITIKPSPETKDDQAANFKRELEKVLAVSQQLFLHLNPNSIGQKINLEENLIIDCN